MKPLERIIEYQHRYSFMLHILKLLSLSSLILSKQIEKHVFTDMDGIT